MALSKNARVKLQKLVQQSKRLLFKDISDQLRQFYGIYPETGKILLVAELPTNDAGHYHTAKLLRQRIAYIKSNIANSNNNGIESIEQLIREQAFSVLNRLAALRMAEERNFIRESIRKDYSSEGFQVYDSITGQGQTAEIFIRYTWYLHSIFDELALDLPAVFDRFSPFAILFPGEQALIEVLSLINNHELSNHREEGQPGINLWRDDETIGWIYQYYNSREEIKAMRDASDAPRNSRELAIRNQFFTPRYVVQFLTDNSLGRVWYEMTKGKTELKTFCQYLIIWPNEVFLEKGDIKPAKGSDDTFYIDYRQIKDPREIYMLDPACGSMHFGLYSFDLFEIIYIEAWDKYPDLMTDLKNTITRTDFIRKIPELIIRHNIHGVDIDPRALQIAALSLWLRAQRSFDKLNLQPADRPQITKSNLVLAEPMPGDSDLLHQVVEPLDKPMQELVLHIWHLMKMAGETGLLLRIEKEIDLKIQSIAYNLKEEAKKAQLQISNDKEKQKIAEEAAYYSTKQYREEFLDKAETQVLSILKHLAHEAHNGNAYQKLLFGDDSARGFSFIELCRKHYDVVLMNPPFGSASINTENYFLKNYPNWGKNILAAFFSRMLEIITDNGLVGAIYDRTAAIKSSYEGFRKECLCGHITVMADTGWNVLEANVETTTTVFKKANTNDLGTYFDLLKFEQKEVELYKSVADLKSGNLNLITYLKDSYAFNFLPNSVIGYQWSEHLIKLFSENKSLSDSGLQVRQGHSLVSDQHFRLYHEIIQYSNYHHLFNGGPYSLFYLPYRDLTKYGNDGYLVSSHKSTVIRNKEYQLKFGIGYGKRGEILDCQIVKENSTFAVEGLTISDISKDNCMLGLSFLNSSFSQFVINLYSGQHKQAGYVNLLPLPIVEFNTGQVNEILNIKRKWVSLDETTLEFAHLITKFKDSDSIKKKLCDIQNDLINDKLSYTNLINQNDDFWLEVAKIPDQERIEYEKLKKARPKENLISIDGVNDENVINNPSMAYEIISNLLGVAFGRWDIRSIKEPSLIPDFCDFLEPLPFIPVVSLSDSPKDYPINIPQDGIFVQDPGHNRSISKAVERVVYNIWEKNSDNILNELAEIGRFSDLQEFFAKPSGFFDFHYIRYSKSRREAPIYWPISTQSGSYTFWLYYPKLNDQTLFKVVLDYIKPKRESVLDNIRIMQNNPNLDNKGLKELREQNNLYDELNDLENELINIANLPFKPNHDDGVLITAAPLYKLFRHNKWHKSTEDCWNALQAGEYDWSHLAYSIWPERVRKKCAKDLSMAIAHGLEEICEVKPKEKKLTNKKVPKEIKINPQLNIDA